MRRGHRWTQIKKIYLRESVLSAERKVSAEDTDEKNYLR